MFCELPCIICLLLCTPFQSFNKVIPAEPLTSSLTAVIKKSACSCLSFFFFCVSCFQVVSPRLTEGEVVCLGGGGVGGVAWKGSVGGRLLVRVLLPVVCCVVT